MGCATSSQLNAVKAEIETLNKSLKQLDTTQKTSLAGMRRTQSSHISSMKAEETKHLKKFTNAVESLEEERKRLEEMSKSKESSFSLAEKKRSDEFERRVNEAVSVVEEKERALDSRLKDLNALAEKWVERSVGSSGEETKKILDEMVLVVQKYKVLQTPMQEQWRRDIYTCYEHQCAEDVVEEAEDAREVDGREVGEDEGDEVMMARIISLKNSYALNKWGGKKWDGENSQWVVSLSEEANDETKDEPTASLEPSESEPLPPPAPTFTSFKVDFSLPVMNAFRAHFPALVSDDAEDRDFLRFLMFFADGDGDGDANEVNNDNEATAPKKTKNLRRASICV